MKNIKMSSRVRYASYYSYSISADQLHAFQPYVLKECHLGIRKDNRWKTNQLTLMVGEFRLLDYNTMAENKNIPLSVWNNCSPSSLDLARGGSWFYFSADNSIGFLLKDGKGREIERKIYIIEDRTMRELFG